MALIPPTPTGSLPGSYAWNDWIEKIRTIVNQLSTSISWSVITGKPTTIAGFGITDGVTLTGVQTVTSKTYSGVSITLTGGISTGNNVLHTTTTALTNGAAAAVGTLNNAPAAGNPTKWVPINDNGTTRYIPAW